MNQGIAFQLTLTGSAQNLANNPVEESVTIAAPSTNTGIVYIGFASTVSSSTGYILEKGTSVILPLAGGNTNQVYVDGTASDKISVIGA